MAGAELFAGPREGFILKVGVVFDPGAGVDLSPNARAPLAQWAIDVQRVGEFVARGRGPVEFDCMGMVLWAQQQIGRRVRDYLELYASLDIASTGDVDALFRAERDAWRNVDAGGVGDVLVLGHGSRAHHVAVLCGAGRALHASASGGVLIQELPGRMRVRRFASMKVFACVAPN